MEFVVGFTSVIICYILIKSFQAKYVSIKGFSIVDIKKLNSVIVYRGEATKTSSIKWKLIKHLSLIPTVAIFAGNFAILSFLQVEKSRASLPLSFSWYLDYLDQTFPPAKDIIHLALDFPHFYLKVYSIATSDFMNTFLSICVVISISGIMLLFPFIRESTGQTAIKIAFEGSKLTRRQVGVRKTLCGLYLFLVLLFLFQATCQFYLFTIFYRCSLP